MGVIEEKVFDGMKYIVRFPDKHKELNRHPVILILHGAGLRNVKISELKSCFYIETLAKYDDLGFITVAPLCERDTWFDLFETVEKFAEFISLQPYCDKNRLSLLGASMGGYAVWQLAMSLPHLFSAMVPICGGGMYWNASRLKNIPIKAFHGAKDDEVFCDESKKMVDAVNKTGGNAVLTIYPNNGHDAWSDTINNKEVIKWLVSQTKKNDEIGRNQLDPVNFG